MLKRAMSILLMVTILAVCLNVPVFAAPDEPSAWAKADVEDAIKLELVPERLQGDYQKVITREEFASLFVTMIFAYQKLQYPDYVDKPFYTYDNDHPVTREEVLRQVKVTDYSFTDTDSEDVKLAYIMGLVNGTSETTFSPNQPVTRQEAAVMLAAYGSPEAYMVGNKTNLERFMSRYTDLSKAAPWAKEYVNLAFYRGVLKGITGDRDEMSTSKITLDPLGNFTREQAIVVAYRLYKVIHQEVYGVPVFNVYLRGCVLFWGDALGINWEVGKNSVTAISMTEELKKAQELNWSLIKLTMFNFSYIGFADWYVSNEALIAAYPRIAVPTQFITSEAMHEFSQGKHGIYDIGFAEYEGNNPNYIFQMRFKNNGFYTHNTYGGGKMLPIECKKIK